MEKTFYYLKGFEKTGLYELPPKKQNSEIRWRRTLLQEKTLKEFVNDCIEKEKVKHLKEDE